MYPTRRSALARPRGSDASPSVPHEEPTEAERTGGTADPSLIVHDARSAGIMASEGTLAFAVTNRGPESVRLAALDLDCDDASVSVVGEGRLDHGYEVWVDARRPARTRVGPTALPTTISLDERASVDPGETATVWVYGFRHADETPADLGEYGATVTLRTERNDRRFETTAHLTV